MIPCTWDVRNMTIHREDRNRNCIMTTSACWIWSSASPPPWTLCLSKSVLPVTVSWPLLLLNLLSLLRQTWGWSHITWEWHAKVTSTDTDEVWLRGSLPISPLGNLQCGPEWQEEGVALYLAWIFFLLRVGSAAPLICWPTDDAHLASPMTHSSFL